MSSANEQLAPPPKPRLSPLDFRNTDLVSRLLAATPPYLYNMSLLPNTYFFSEMLRSFVQAKSEQGRGLPGSFQTRRMRKRPWSNSTPKEPYQKTSPKPEQSPDWSVKPTYVEHRPGDSPLELTTSNKLAESTEQRCKTPLKSFPSTNLHEQVNPIFPNLNQESNPGGLILPPPPPMWYPPLYPTAPYGIDPLHFFIDLRVSGHIYDRKNQRGGSSETQEHEATTTSSSKSPDVPMQETGNNSQQIVPKETVFKQSRHASAFSVPTPHLQKNLPINLSHNEECEDGKNLKFPVKSMVAEKKCNQTGTNYIMNNIRNIYSNLSSCHQGHVVKSEDESVAGGHENETEEQREKRVRDLRALIGLELVVDYMNHAKPQVRRIPEESSSTDMESIGSPTLEVVALHDDS